MTLFRKHSQGLDSGTFIPHTYSPGRVLRVRWSGGEHVRVVWDFHNFNITLNDMMNICRDLKHDVECAARDPLRYVVLLWETGTF